MTADTERLEQEEDFYYRCQSCGDRYPCGCGNPYYETVLTSVVAIDPPNGVANEQSLASGTDRPEGGGGR